MQFEVFTSGSMQFFTGSTGRFILSSIMMMNDQAYVLHGTPSTEIPLLWDSGTDLQIGIYLCAWSDIETT